MSLAYPVLRQITAYYHHYVYDYFSEGSEGASFVLNRKMKDVDPSYRGHDTGRFQILSFLG